MSAKSASGERTRPRVLVLVLAPSPNALWLHRLRKFMPARAPASAREARALPRITSRFLCAHLHAIHASSYENSRFTVTPVFVVVGDIPTSSGLTYARARYNLFS